MKVVIQRTLKETEERPILDKNGKSTGRTEVVETGEETLEQKTIPLVDYNENKKAIKSNGWEVIAEANIIDLKKSKFFDDQKDTDRNY